MTFALLASFGSLFIALILFLSGMAKLQFSLQERERHLLAMAFPHTRATRAIALFLAPGEIILSAVLICLPGIPGIIFHYVAVLLFSAYVFVVSRQLFGSRPGVCPCFGKPRRVGPWTLTRNVVYLAWSLLALWGVSTTGASPIWAIAEDQVGIVVLTLGALTGLVTSKARYAAIEEDTEAMRDYLRLPVPAFTAWQPGTGTTDLRRLCVTGPKLLIIGEHRSVEVLTVVKRIPRWRVKLPQLDVLPVVRAADPEWKSQAEKTGSEPWYARYLNDTHGQIFQGFGANLEDPMAVLLGADGLLAGGPVIGAQKIEAFVDVIAAELRASPTAAVDDSHGDSQ